jgi:two-component system sensor histidine kinase GlrK
MMTRDQWSSVLPTWRGSGNKNPGCASLIYDIIFLSIDGAVQRIINGGSGQGMKFGIFPRSTVGYLMVVLLLGGSNIYAIMKLAEFNAIILRSHIEDSRLLETEKKLADFITTQQRYEQKYLLTKDALLHKQFLQAKEDFERLLAEMTSLAFTPKIKATVEKIKEQHERYQSLAATEAKFLKTNGKYDRYLYRREKDKATDAILAELEELEEYSRTNFYDKMKRVSEAGVSARRVALISLGLTILLTVLLSFLITRSITNPLLRLVKKTRDIPAGVFDCELEGSTPPEIAELTEAFMLMCNRLKEVDRMKADLFAMISHELRTPLTTIKEGTSLLLERVGGTITEKQEKLLTIIATESSRLTGLVNSILDLSKMEAGMMVYTFAERPILPLIEQAVREITPYAESRRLRIEKQLQADLPLVRMDGERILDVLRNLLGNAVKFTPEKGCITISAHPFAGWLEVAVSDTGPGIPSDKFTAIFEKYVSSDQKKGTGLGLAIVKHIVIAHGGKVWVENAPGGGSKFIFALPS